MTKIVWHESGKRTFELGIDRGVLYPRIGTGIAWPGLVSVVEAPTGGDPKAFYMDGFKYANILSNEEYAATINALTSPKEFDLCDGVASISNGLFVTQQRRRPFDFSYRTMIGSDLDPAATDYKIHMVYNALAKSSGKTNQTLSSTLQLTPQSWQITTIPEKISTKKPTAHLYIQASKTNAITLAILEAYLYGIDGIDPQLPSPTSIVSIFGFAPAYTGPKVTIFSLLSSTGELPSVSNAGDAYIVNNHIWVSNGTAFSDYGTIPTNI